jgi:hypothetical protein
MLTREEELFVATRLLSRARHSSKKLENAHGKTLHPVLLKQIHDDVAECTRLALKLQGAQTVTVCEHEWTLQYSRLDAGGEQYTDCCEKCGKFRRRDVPLSSC